MEVTLREAVGGAASGLGAGLAVVAGVAGLLADLRCAGSAA